MLKISRSNGGTCCGAKDGSTNRSTEEKGKHSAVETKIRKAFDGTDIYMTKDTVEGPRAVLVIVHGLAEHSGRYDYVTRRLNESRFAVYRFDNRGHGRSGGPRGENDRLDKFLKDTHMVVNLAMEENKGAPVFMLGHSMGGLITAAYGAAHGNILKGQITSGAVLDALPMFKPLEETYTEEMGKQMMPNTLAELICRDPEVVKAYQDDPLVLKETTIRLLYTTFVQGVAWLEENLDQYTYPCLILHGEGDQLVPAASSQWFYTHVPSKDKTIKIYPGCYHEILNEKVEKDQVIADIAAWINARL
jgi:acylglycerol lipase